jgi:mono/diheme cytochrome c family protein
MRGLKIVRVVFVNTVLGSFVLLLPAQNMPPKKLPDTPSGAELYTRHCAVCHGNDLRGAGPFPPPYRKPPDLTKLARRHEGKFPEAYVGKVLRNGVTLPAHGPAEMPVWGSDFAAKERIHEAEVADRIRRLVLYLRSAQVQQTSRPDRAKRDALEQ